MTILELLSSAWQAIKGCFVRQLDDEINRQIEIHEQNHVSQYVPRETAPIVINFSVSQNSTPLPSPIVTPEPHRKLRRNGTTDIRSVMSHSI